MIQVLIVDDDETKQRRIADVIVEALGLDNTKVFLASSAADAAASLEQNGFELLVLDMNLPLRQGEIPQRNGGIRLLRSIVRGGPRLRRPQHIIGLSAYDELVSEFKSEFHQDSLHLLRYESGSIAWEEVLARRAIYISGAVDSVSNRDRFETDLAIVTALKTIELEAVLDLPANWISFQQSDDDTYYHRGTFTNGERELSVVCCAGIEMGLSAAACLTQKVISNFSPKYVAMAGITAGIGSNFGDIVVADQSWDYGAGKIRSEQRKSIFRPSPNYIAIDAGLKEKIQFFAQSRRSIINEIRDSWKGGTPDTALSVHVGPMASGAAVVESETEILAIMEHNRKVIAVEMETYGVYLACRTSRKPQPKCFSAKSVCDFGVPPKTDEYQRYAAYTSASFVHRFSLDQL